MSKPIGLESHGREFTHLKLKHWIIKEHQRMYPSLTAQMKAGSNATNIYSYFLASLPFRMSDILNKDVQGYQLQFTKDIEEKLLNEYRIKR
jgi:hypothetical protein